MTSRQYGLEISIEGRDEISKALQQAQSLVQRATQQLNRDLESTERQVEDTGRAAETAGQRIRRSLIEGMDSAGQAMRSAGRSMSQAGQSLTTGVTIPLAAAGLAFAKFNDVATSLQVEGQFRRTAEGVGLSADRMMTAIRTASGGIIDDTKLQAETTRAMALGVGEDMQQVSTLWQLARLQARELGGTVDQSFQRMTQAIAQGSAETLISQGFTIRSEQLFAEYAKTMGTTTAEMDQNTRAQLVLNAVLEEGAQKLSKADLATLNEAESLQRMQAELSNTTDNLLRNLIPALETTLGLFNALPGPVKTATILMLGLALAAGPVASGLGAIVQGVGIAVQGLTALAKSQRVAAVTSRLLAVSLRGVLIASGIGILIVVLGLLLANWETTWSVIQTVTGAVVGFISQHFDKLLLFLGPAGWILLGLKNMAGGWGELWGKVKDTAAFFINPVIGLINKLIGAMNAIPGVNIGEIPTIGGEPARAAQVSPIPTAHQGAITRSAGLVSVMPNEAIIPLSGRGPGGIGGGGVTVVNHFHGLVVRDESDIDYIANRVRGSLDGIR